MKKASIVCSILAIVIGMAAIVMTGCSDAETVDNNLTQAADNFELNRRVVFFNGITDKYLLTIEGRISITADTEDGQLEVLVKTGPDEFKKHHLGLSDNVSYFSEQLDAAKVDVYHYRVIYKPETIIPNVDIDTSGGQ